MMHARSIYVLHKIRHVVRHLAVVSRGEATPNYSVLHVIYSLQRRRQDSHTAPPLV